MMFPISTRNSTGGPLPFFTRAEVARFPSIPNLKGPIFFGKEGSAISRRQARHCRLVFCYYSPCNFKTISWRPLKASGLGALGFPNQKRRARQEKNCRWAESPAPRYPPISSVCCSANDETKLVSRRLWSSTKLFPRYLSASQFFISFHKQAGQGGTPFLASGQPTPKESLGNHDPRWGNSLPAKDFSKPAEGMGSGPLFPVGHQKRKHGAGHGLDEDPLATVRAKQSAPDYRLIFSLKRAGAPEGVFQNDISCPER